MVVSNGSLTSSSGTRSCYCCSVLLSTIIISVSHLSLGSSFPGALRGLTLEVNGKRKKHYKNLSGTVTEILVLMKIGPCGLIYLWNFGL